MLRAEAIFWASFMVSGLMILSACTVYGEHPVLTVADATGGEGFEQGFWREIKSQNWRAMEQHIAGNFVYVTPAGRLERTAAIAELEKMRVSDYSLGDVTTEMNGDTFVVTYTITLHGGSGVSNQPQRRMSVWQKQKAGWLLIAHSVLGPSGV
jgi:hypothetical protein